MPTPSSKKPDTVYIVLHTYGDSGEAFNSKTEAEDFIAEQIADNENTDFRVFIGREVSFSHETKVTIDE